MAKIQGHIGKHCGEIATLQVTVKPRKYIAIERFIVGQDEGGKNRYRYIETPYDPKKTKGLDRLIEYLRDNRREKGTESTEKQYFAGLRNTKSKSDKAARASVYSDWNRDIKTDLHGKTPAQIRRIIKAGESANKEFFELLTL